MYRKIKYSAIALLPGFAMAHEWTPTYPELRKSYVEGVNVTSMVLFNKREDVSYYEIEVYDEEWNPLPFASAHKVFQINHLGTKKVDIYFREEDDITYICTASKSLKKDVKSSGIKSRICSKVKKE